MATVTSTQIVSDRVQSSGDRKIHERFTGSDARVEDRQYRLAAGADALALATARIPQVEEQWANKDAEAELYAQSSSCRQKIFVYYNSLTEAQKIEVFGVTVAEIDALGEVTQ
tara:strand:+ start:14765 stop:15103 length:339 start_codon:yes stop_codon:yes gene_type:complete